MLKRLLSCLLFIGVVHGVSPAQIAYAIPDGVQRHWSFVTFGRIPVQSGGRIKPLDSFAREIVLFETGSRSYEGWNSLDLILSWIAAPHYWDEKPFIRVGREDVRRQLGLDEKRVIYSPKELFENENLAQYANHLESGGLDSQTTGLPGAPKADPREQELKSVLDRVGLFHGILTGQGWPLIPRPLPEAWSNLALPQEPKLKLGGKESSEKSLNDRHAEAIRDQFLEVIKAYVGGEAELFERSAFLLKEAVESEIPQYHQTLKNPVLAESIYNRTRPFLIAWVLYLCAGLSWMVCQIDGGSKGFQSAKARVKKVALLLTGLAALSQGVGIALRCFVAGRPPVTNMYESVIWVSLGVIVFAWILYLLQSKGQRQGIILGIASILAMLGLIAGDAAPAILDPSLHPLVPVLRSNYWLTIHVLTITLGYAAFALTLGLANFTLFQSFKFGKKDATKGAKANSKSSKMTALNLLTYRAMQFGVVLIAAGTILGGIWADASWGRFWGWDPKEVWALITLLCYLMILHGRYAGWVGPFGFAAWSALSFLSVVMAWYGVNFILGVGLHSYGFSTGGTPWVLGFVVAQLAYIGLATGFHYRAKA